MLGDIDLKYQAGALATGKDFVTSGALTSASVTVTGSAAVGSLAVGGVAFAGNPSSWEPEDYSLIAWSYDPAVGTTNTTATANGTIYLSAVRIRRPATITNVHWAPNAAGVTPTSGQNFAALVNSSGVILSSVGVDALVTSGPGTKTTAILAAPQSVTAGMYWVALLFNAGTPPVLLRTSGQQAGTNNYGLTAAALRFATNGTGATVLPASFTPGSNGSGPSLWVAVS